MICPTCEPWLMEILRDPIGKTPLSQQGDSLLSADGRAYAKVYDAYDLRPLTAYAGTIGQMWKRGQVAYENWSKTLSKDEKVDYSSERQGVADVYRAIPIKGRVLDVGGHDGRLRAFLDQDQQYVSLDPFPGILIHQPSRARLATYPFLDGPLNFIAGVAEHLPFSDASFGVVHMRSCIDHFLNPELALREAHRVLHPEGYLVIGLTVHGGKSGRVSNLDRVKESVRAILTTIGVERFADHHIWHPTFSELTALVELTGFSMSKVYWQPSEAERVCYLRADRVPAQPA